MVAALAPPDMTGTYLLLLVVLVWVLVLVGLVIWAAPRFRHWPLTRGQSRPHEIPWRITRPTGLTAKQRRTRATSGAI